MELKWKMGSPPVDREASYLVWYNTPNLGSMYGHYIVTKVSNGFISIVGGHFASEMLDKDLYIVAYAEIPPMTKEEFYVETG